MPQTYLDVMSRDELTTRSEQLAYDCGMIMKKIGKFRMWEDWLDEEDMYREGPEQERFWERKLKEAWAAEATHGLNEEQRAEYNKTLAELRKEFVRLSYEAGCASSWFWEERGEAEEYCADAVFFWREEIDELEKMATERKRAERERAAAAATGAGEDGTH